MGCIFGPLGNALKKLCWRCSLPPRGAWFSIARVALTWTKARANGRTHRGLHRHPRRHLEVPPARSASP
eukprot:7575615-Alexandrium_andersonii.AAC.1